MTAPRLTKLMRNLRRGIPSATLKVYSYAEATEMMARVRPAFPAFPMLFRRLG